MRAIVDEPIVNERVMLEERRRTIADQEIHRRLRKGAPQILEQCGRQYDVTETPELHDEHATRRRGRRRLHSVLRHSFAY
jgi:hypothetical protein